MMVKGNYKDVTMKIDVWDKDMQVIGDYARKIKVPTPMFDASKPVYIKAMKSGFGAQGHRRRLRRAGEDGEGEAQEALSHFVIPGSRTGRQCHASGHLSRVQRFAHGTTDATLRPCIPPLHLCSLPPNKISAAGGE